jgi:hypothetical protein
MSRKFSLNAFPLLILLFLFGTVSLSLAAQPDYDPPQPSSEFGTAEATAKIAAKAGYLDIVGVKLGMSPKDAVAAVKAHNAAIVLEPTKRRNRVPYSSHGRGGQVERQATTGREPTRWHEILRMEDS